MKISMEALTGFANSRPWTARWIWVAGAQPAPENTFALFRKEFVVREGRKVRVFISADTRYRLYVNGKFVGQGPPMSQPYFQYYNEHDLGAVVKRGRNCIGVIVQQLGTIPSARGGLLAEVVDGNGKVLEATGEAWKGMISGAWKRDMYRVVMNALAPFQENFDARAFPERFAKTGFDDGKGEAWAAAEAVKGRVNDRPPATGPWSRLVARDIPYMAQRRMRALRVERVGESLGLANRTREEDLSIGLSQSVKDLKWAKADGVENLVTGERATIFRCSTEHLRDVAFDGVYEPSVLLDFGKVITGYLELDLEGKAGAAVEIGYAERLVDGEFHNAFEGQFADRYVMRAGRQRFVPFNWRAFRYVKLKFREAYEDVKVHGAQVEESTYPFEERGGFASGDALLNQIFEISRHTLRLCSHEAIMDTPWRESSQWLGDVAAVTAPAIHACFGDSRLTGKFLRQAAMNMHPMGLLANISNSVKGNMEWTIPDYSLWWAMYVWEHYLYTGQRKWVENFYPQVLRVLQAHLCHVNERGLVEDMPFWVFVDWADVDKRGECAAYNAIFYGALECIGKMAALQGDRGTMRVAQTLRKAIQANFARRLWDAKRGLLADARIGEEFSAKTSEQGNMAALRFGLVEGKTAQAIVRQLYEGAWPAQVTEAQPFFMVVVLEALRRLGRMDVALRLIKQRWGGRMVEQGASSTYEEWTMNGSRRSGEFKGYMRTISHAWSACPAEFLIRNLMGLEIVEAGCRKICLAPARVDFDYDAKFPTPRGVVRVVHHGGKVEVKAPAGVVVERG